MAVLIISKTLFKRVYEYFVSQISDVAQDKNASEIPGNAKITLDA